MELAALIGVQILLFGGIFKWALHGTKHPHDFGPPAPSVVRGPVTLDSGSPVGPV